MKQLKLALIVFGWSVAMAAAQDRGVSFNRDIRPILSENCYYCHGFDPSHREADLRLDTAEGAVQGGAIVPGKPEESELIKRIYSTDPDEVMPVPKSHRTLTNAQKDLLKTWIAQGAKYEPHWAFIPPPAEVPVPRVQPPAWPQSEMDRFVLARLEQEGLTPTPEATRERWLRRVTLDLTGLPPSQGEIDSFAADLSSEAYARVVDRLLASPRFGERMAVPWLDVARYADSFGYQADVDTNAWPYRDWVIRALQDNLPWDQFVTWQIAGDLLPEPTRDQRLATAFNRLHRKTNEGGSVPEEMRQDGVSDRVHTFGTAFLALTFECSRCHDHKYDPITAKDYYSLGAFFNSIEEFGLIQGGANRGLTMPQPALALTTAEQDRKLAAQQAAAARTEQLLRELPAHEEVAFQQWLTGKPQAVVPGQVAHFPLEAVAGGKSKEASGAGDGGRTDGNLVVPGKVGKALGLNGDEALSLPGYGIDHAHDPMSFSFWVKPGELYPRAVVLANTSSFDANYCGYELLLEKGFLRWTVMREFPGNAISIKAVTPLPVGEWTQVTATYDGSMRAAGLRLYVNGLPAVSQLIRDGLKRDYRIGKALEFGARGRDFGLRGGALDEVRVFIRSLTAVEAAHLFDGHALTDLLANGPTTGEGTQVLRNYFFAAIHPGALKLQERLNAERGAWQETMAGVPEISVMEESAPRPTFIQNRGAYDAPGEAVGRAVPAVLPPLPAGAPMDRLGLAQWLTHPDHPLTARVLVNRIWQEFFGQGIVPTVDNFGTQGAMPSHPELLDWLARDFIKSGWDHKLLCKKIVLSAVYRQDSRASEELRVRDPDNVLLARGPARRLTAEMLRDSALALGGLLQPQVGGPPVLPVQAEGSMWKSLNNFLPEYKADAGAGRHRRSLYTFWRRTTTPPNMMALDAVSRDVCAVRRLPTNTPLQPLVLMNDPQFAEAALALGSRILREGGTTAEAQMAWAFREVCGRSPTTKELSLVLGLLGDQRRLFSEDPAKAEALVKTGGQTSEANNAAPVELAAAAAVASALFNLDASLMQR